jgi:hypothetical protein
VLVVGTGYGIDGFGLGKYGGDIQVIVHQTDGQQRIFLADVPYAIAGWFLFPETTRCACPRRPIHGLRSTGELNSTAPDLGKAGAGISNFSSQGECR